jgi:NADH-quinone oxidoreductase subunit N
MTTTAELIYLLPEIILLVCACAILIVDAVSAGNDKSLIYRLAQLALIVTALSIVYVNPGDTVTAFSNNFVLDPMGATLKFIICMITLVVFFYSWDYLKEHELIKGEYFVLGLFAVLGMMVMTSAHTLLTVYLGLELLSLSLYAMVAMHRDSQKASEAAIKYFVLGALASGMLLYGMSMLYGVSGTLELVQLSAYISSQGSGNNLLLVFGLVFVIVGIGFKLGAVPFHMWVPDVYEGSPTSVTLFISSAPKIAAFAMAMRLLVDGLHPLVQDWQGMLIILSVLSMVAGNIIAIAQANIKRMLAYSTISHIGFLLLGLIAASGEGYAASMFYVVIYALMSMGGFGMVILLGRKGKEADYLDDFRGLSERSPWFAFVMLILMFSMAGVPPFVGFWAKWFVIKEVITAGYTWLAAIAVIFSVVGAYYYIRIIKLMYFDKPVQMTAIKASQEMRMVLSLNALSLLFLGIFPAVLMALCFKAMGV